MIAKKNKRIEITLNPNDLELLTSLSLRFNRSKTQIISQALKVLAAKNKHVYTVVFSKPKDEESYQEKNEMTDEEIDEVLSIFKADN